MRLPVIDIPCNRRGRSESARLLPEDGVDMPEPRLLRLIATQRRTTAVLQCARRRPAVTVFRRDVGISSARAGESVSSGKMTVASSRHGNSLSSPAKIKRSLSCSLILACTKRFRTTNWWPRGGRI